MEAMQNNNDISYIEGPSNFDSLFYTFDKSIEKMNDDDIFQAILKKYPTLVNDELGDIVLKKIVVDFFEDEKFIEKILKDFDMNITDLLKTFYRKLGWIFNNAMFVKKISAIVLEKSYARQFSEK